MEAIEEKDYNTRRTQMAISEYGRNIQKMVEHAIALENREERNKMAHGIISVMGQLNPHLRDIADFKHKLWDHLFIISDFKLEVDSPYPLPNREVIFEKPQKMDYPATENRFKHYGKSIKDLIDTAVKYEDGDEKNALIQIIVNLMKKTYLTFNQDSVEDKQILADLKLISKGQLTVPETLQILGTNDILSMNKKKTPPTNKNGKQPQKKQNFKKRRY